MLLFNLKNFLYLNVDGDDGVKNSRLAQKLRELRKAHSYTQYDVATMLGVVRQTYSHYETGKRVPDPETLYKLAGFYNISVEDLMHLAIELDEADYFDAPAATRSSHALDAFLSYTNNPANQKKLKTLSSSEKELLFYFSLLSPENRREILDFLKIKAVKTCEKRL